jgi:hypothetical protein
MTTTTLGLDATEYEIAALLLLSSETTARENQLAERSFVTNQQTPDFKAATFTCMFMHVYFWQSGAPFFIVRK